MAYEGDRPEIIFALCTANKLKDKVKGFVYCRAEDDVLTVSIDAGDKYPFKIEYDDLIHKIINGYSSDDVVTDVMKKYQKYIIKKAMKKYFKEET